MCDKIVFIFHLNVTGPFNKCISHMMGWQNFDLLDKNVNIKAYKVFKNKEKFELFTINLN
jgi:hypothetical protein